MTDQIPTPEANVSVTLPTLKQTAAKPRRMAREPGVRENGATTPAPPEASAAVPRVTKSEIVLELLRRPDGVTTDELREATGWLAHSARAFLIGL